MSTPAPGRPRRSLAALAMVTAAALIFAVLLILVRLRWPPLESLDHDAAADSNRLISGDHALVTVAKAVTWLGSNVALGALVAAVAAFLALRKRWRLAVYLLVTSAGALVLDPVLKSLVGRLRPVVAHPVAYGTGSSFPSGHSLGSIVCYGAVLLVFLPAVRGRSRTIFTSVTAALVALVGISRILLGVHYLSDVIAAWAIGVAWLGVTAFAFELTRRAAGQPVTDPLRQGLEPEARTDLRPAQPEPAADDARGRHHGRIAAGTLVAWVLILGVLVGLGDLVTRHGNGNMLGDRAVPRWLAAHRTPTLTSWSLIFTTAGGTVAILSVCVAVCVAFIAVTRHWRPVIYLATVMAGELGAFLIAAAIVRRARPDVSHLDQRLPTSAYPSGHTAAACCLYIAVAILITGHARGWWRWLSLIPAIAMPVLVALWLTATYVLIKPNADSRGTVKRPSRAGSSGSDRISASSRMFAWPGAGRNP